MKMRRDRKWRHLADGLLDANEMIQDGNLTTAARERAREE